MPTKRLALASLLILLLAMAAPAAEKPNVLLIMADDLAYGDLGCYGGERMKTPELDKLASEGVRLTCFHSGSTVCTPSRMALMTGAYPPRLGWRGGVVGYGLKTVNGLTPDALTMAEVFKSAGYATGMCGKWHLGNTAELSPLVQGFDSAYHIKMSNNQCKELFRGDEMIEKFDNRHLTENFTDEAIKFITANKDKPFFLYMPLSAPHFPAQSHPEWKGKSANEAYGDVVEEMDSRLGDVFKALAANGLEKKTIVVFISDNGPDPSQRKWASAKPFRGMKWSALEGGTRVPCIVRWPGVVPAGKECDKLTTSVDLLPTLAHATGIGLSKISKGKPKIDGVNVWDTLLGKKVPHARKDLLYWHGWATPQAIRVGDWKLYFDRVKEIRDSSKAPALFNVVDDPTEETNLAEKHPEKVKELLAIAKEKLEDIDKNFLPLGGPPINKPKPKKRGAWQE